MENNESEENPTEFVMKKEGSYILIWAVIDGEEVFHASPPVTAAGDVIQAAVKTFITRAWEQEFNDLLEDDSGHEGWFR